MQAKTLITRLLILIAIMGVIALGIRPVQNLALAADQGVVDFTLVPSASEVGVNEVFSVDIVLTPGPDTTMSGAQVSLDFDASKLEVVEIVDGTDFEFVLDPEFDNESGQLDYAAINISDDPLTNEIVLAEIVFQAIESTSGETTLITFPDVSNQNPRATLVNLNSRDVTGELVDTEISIFSLSVLSINKRLVSSEVVAGTDVTYEIDVANTGSTDSLGVIVEDTLPAGTTFVSSGEGQHSNGVVT